MAADPSLQSWVTAVGVAKARTGDNLGTKYPIISQQTVDRGAEGGKRCGDAFGGARGRPVRGPGGHQQVTQTADRRESHDNRQVQGAVGRAAA